ncbi:MAG: hypothetical protein ACRYE9_05265 [Janthinobacterium lividum]
MFNINDQEKIDIIELDCRNEANAMRSILENFNFQVRIHYIGNVQHLISIMKEPNYLHRIAIISCHGSNEGLLLPDLAPDIEQKMPFHKLITPENFDSFLSLNKQLIINTGCCLGNTNFARTFINKGATAYIGSTNYTEANSATLFVINFLYHYLCKKKALSKSHALAANIDEETRLFKLSTS